MTKWLSLSLSLSPAWAERLPDDEVEGDYEDQPARPDLPSSTRTPETPSLPCSQPEFEADIEVSMIDGSISVSMPTKEGVASWRLDARLYYADLRTDWSTFADSETSIPIAVPREAYGDVLQEEWLSEVWVHAVGLDSRGRMVGRVPLEVLWVVWSDGPLADPRWLDETARLGEAPLRAWSVAARATMPAVTDEIARTTEVEPPRSTP